MDIRYVIFIRWTMTDTAKPRGGTAILYHLLYNDLNISDVLKKLIQEKTHESHVSGQCMVNIK